MRDRMAVPCIGAGLFFILARFASIPGPVAGSELSLQVPFLAFLAALYGPAAGLLTGLAGQALTDLAGGGFVISRLLSIGLYGLLSGLLRDRLRLENGEFSGGDILRFNLFQLAGHAAVWFLADPCLKILLEQRPVNEAFLQGLACGISHMITTALVGTVLCLIWKTSRPGKER